MAQRRLTLTTRGVVALWLVPVAAVAGPLLGAEELVLVAVALATLLVCGLVQSAYRATRARGNWTVGVELGALDAEVESDVALNVSLSVPAESARSARVPLWLEDPQHCWTRVGRGGPAAGTGSGTDKRLRAPNPSFVLPVSLPEGERSRRLRFSAPTDRRGVFTLRALHLWCFDSFGLVARLVAVGPTATLTVHPTPLAVELSEEVLRGDHGVKDLEPITVVRHPKRDSFGDFSGIRAYIPGDRLRLLYWPALARTGELMVRDFEDDGPHRVQVVADVRPLIGTAGSESVLAAAAGVGLLALSQGSVVDLSTTSGERTAIAPGPHGDLTLLRAIAAFDTGGSSAPATWWRRRRVTVPGGGEREIHPTTAGAPLVVTTAAGVQALPGAFGFAHVVVAP